MRIIIAIASLFLIIGCSGNNMNPVDFKDKKPKCLSGDSKKTIVNGGVGRVNFFTGKGKRKKYLGVIVK